jgi:hypothetical protein
MKDLAPEEGTIGEHEEGKDMAAYASAIDFLAVLFLIASLSPPADRPTRRPR